MVRYFDGLGKEVTNYVQTLEEQNNKLKREVSDLLNKLATYKHRSIPKTEKKQIE